MDHMGAELEVNCSTSLWSGSLGVLMQGCILCAIRRVDFQGFKVKKKAMEETKK